MATALLLDTQRVGNTLWAYAKNTSDCGKITQEQRVPGLIVEVRAQGLQADVITYSAAISACAKITQWQR